MSDCHQSCKVCGYRHDPCGGRNLWCQKCGACMLRPGPETENAISRLEAELVELVEALRSVVDACGICSGTGFLRDHPDIPCRACGYVLKLLAKYEKTGKTT